MRTARPDDPSRPPRKAKPGASGHTGPGAGGSRRREPGPDPRGALVLDIRELGRRPGSMQELHREVPAPTELGTPMIGVEPGATLALDARLESVVEGVLVTAHLRAPLTGECSRCLEPVHDQADVRLQELFSYPERLADLGVEAADEESLTIVDDLIDLEPTLRDALVLSLPLSPLCSEDCAGLTLAGERRERHEPDGAQAAVDPRWAALQELTND